MQQRCRAYLDRRCISDVSSVAETVRRFSLSLHLSLRGCVSVTYFKIKCNLRMILVNIGSNRRPYNGLPQATGLPFDCILDVDGQ